MPFYFLDHLSLLSAYQSVNRLFSNVNFRAKIMSFIPCLSDKSVFFRVTGVKSALFSHFSEATIQTKMLERLHKHKAALISSSSLGVAFPRGRAVSKSTEKGVMSSSSVFHSFLSVHDLSLCRGESLECLFWDAVEPLPLFLHILPRMPPSDLTLWQNPFFL